MAIFKKAFLNFLVLAIAACSIASGSVTTSRAAAYMGLETVPSKVATETILNDIGLTKKDLDSKKKVADISEELSELIPAKVDDYARKRASALIETVKKNPEDFGVTIDKDVNLQIETPFIIYSAESLGKQDSIYYYPIANNHTIILVLYIMEYNGDYSAGISTDYASMLNKLDYQNNDDYLFYQDGKNLYAENNDTTENLSDMPQSEDRGCAE